MQNEEGGSKSTTWDFPDGICRREQHALNSLVPCLPFGVLVARHQQPPPQAFWLCQALPHPLDGAGSIPAAPGIFLSSSQGGSADKLKYSWSELKVLSPRPAASGPCTLQGLLRDFQIGSDVRSGFCQGCARSEEQMALCIPCQRDADAESSQPGKGQEERKRGFSALKILSPILL